MDESNDTRLLRLDHRHLAFFFLGAVAVCAIFFSLGFVVGRGQACEAALKELPSAARIAELKPTDLAPEPNSPLEPSFAEGVSSSPNLSTNSGKPERKGPPGADYRRELDFYSAVKGKNVDENFHPGADGAETGSKTSRKTISKPQAIPVGSLQSKIPSPGSLLTLQVAALKNAPDADKLVKTLRSKGYSVSIVAPRSDDIRKLVRVQLGPFTSIGEATKVKARLERDGYQIITKR